MQETYKCQWKNTTLNIHYDYVQGKMYILRFLANGWKNQDPLPCIYMCMMATALINQ